MTVQQYYEIGKQLYCAFLKAKHFQFIICPCSFGDTVNVVAFLSAYKKIHNFPRVAIVGKDAHKDLIKFFPNVDEHISLPETHIMALRVFIACEGLYNSNNILYGHFEPLDFSFANFKTFGDTSFVDAFKNHILQIPLTSSIDKPVLFQDAKEAAVGENSVLLFPYAQTLSIKNGSFWTELVKALKQQGYTHIYTNVDNPARPVIPGTESLCLSIPDLCRTSKKFKKLIGIRSGIFDVLALFDLSLDVITPCELKTIETSTIVSKEQEMYFDLNKLHSDAKVTNYAYMEGYEEKLIGDILKR